MKNKKSIKLFAVIIVLFSVSIPQLTLATTLSSIYNYTFNSNGTLYETGSMGETKSPYWWVNSGGALSITDGSGSTLIGNLPSSSPWRLVYLANNPVDTDNGYHPQNIFRLVSKQIHQNVSQEVTFRILADNLSSSPNRNSSNGILLFNRYEDGQNLYYSGVRVDGAAVIKKKINGVYYTMAYQKIFSKPAEYDRSIHPNLIPKNTWIGLRSDITNYSDGTVTIILYTDVNKTGNWVKVLEAKDDGKSFGGRAITSAAYSGIRTDFMDVKFDNYKLQDL